MNEARKEALLRKYSYASKQAQMMGGPGRGPGGRGHGGPGKGRGKGPGMPGGKPANTMKSVKRLFGYIRKDRFKLMLVLFCVITNTLASLMVPTCFVPL